MKIIAWIILLPLSILAGVIVASYQWNTYTKRMSRYERYHTSDWDFQKNRILLTIAGFCAPIFVVVCALCMN